jgi:tripartite-type tricarboxylate transporter receptor subunit TctC
VPEFIAYAKANPGKINFASSGSGSTLHISGELFKMMAGVSMVHVPYRGGAAALTDLMAGQVQVMFGSLPDSLQHARSGSLRPLAVTSATRSELLPDLPTVGDFLPGYESTAWYGVVAPKGTPAEIVAMLNKEINSTLSGVQAKARFGELGAEIITGTAAEFRKLLADETEKWAKVVKFAGIKPE